MFSADTRPLPRQRAGDPSQCPDEPLRQSKLTLAGRLGFPPPWTRATAGRVKVNGGIHPLCLTGTLTISPIIFLMPKAASDLMNTPSKVHKLGSEVTNELTHETKY